MKKKLLHIVVALMLTVLPMTIMAKGEAQKRCLIVYYSKTGNTQRVAETIARYTGGDLLRIEPAVPYPENEESFVQRAKREVVEDVNIALREVNVRIQEYEVVFIGSPVWFGDWAAPAATFARDPRLRGKKIIPFMTCGREMTGVTDFLFKKYVKAKPEKGLCLTDKTMKEDIDKEVREWLCELLEMQSCGDLTTMNVFAALRDMKCRYPKITLCDVYKSFYQDFFGAGHIINSKEKAASNIKEEMKQVEGISVGVEMRCRGMFKPATGFEKCGALGRYVRVDLWKVKKGEIKLKEYVSNLMNSVENQVDTAMWLKEWSFVLSVIRENKFAFDNFEEDLNLINARIERGEYGMHHSKVFNECYHPHYRIIKREYVDF